MRKIPLLLGALACALVSKASLAATFDATTGTLHAATDNLLTADFEAGAPFVGKGFTASERFLDFATGKRTSKPFAAADYPALATIGAVPASGTGGLLLGLIDTKGRNDLVGKGIVFEAPETFATLANGRVRLTFWSIAREHPHVALVYGKPSWSIDASMTFAQVTAVPTGRALDDGWAEFSTGDVDASILGIPLRAIVAEVASPRMGGAHFSLDTLELTKVEGAQTGGAACTSVADSVCGRGDCVLGRCVPSEATWGALLSAEHRKELVGRWRTTVSSIQGSRVVASRVASFEAAVPALVAADSPRAFYGGLHKAMQSLGDFHLSEGTPASALANAVVSATVPYRPTSSFLGACFGEVADDLPGATGGSIAVYRTAATSILPTALHVGDVLTEIDGVPAANWLRDATLAHGDRSASDEASLSATWALRAADLIGHHATSFKVLRCSDDACASRSVIDVPIAQVGRDALAANGPSATLLGESAALAFDGGGAPATSTGLVCTGRLKDAVDTLTPRASGLDVVSSTVRSGRVDVQLDGFMPADSTAFEAAFKGFVATGKPLLVDARYGTGGLSSAGTFLAGLLRSSADPLFSLDSMRASVEHVSTEAAFAKQLTCLDTPGALDCTFAQSFTGSKVTSVPKVAWVNGYDVSENDIVPRFLAGGANTRIFSAHPTMGSFGFAASVPAYVAGWGDGSFQGSDSRFARDRAGLSTARWESGHGVTPDEVVVQKLSDLLLGKDTLLVRAAAWTAE